MYRHIRTGSTGGHFL